MVIAVRGEPPSVQIWDLERDKTKLFAPRIKNGNGYGLQKKKANRSFNGRHPRSRWGEIRERDRSRVHTGGGRVREGREVLEEGQGCLVP